MIDINAWVDEFLHALDEKFADRIWFVGLQGSYGRGEATQTSDIDIVVILDELSVSDIRIYNAVLDKLEHRELICGFISGKKEILNWEPSEIFQFYYDTNPIRGSLDELLFLIDDASVDRTIKIGAGNIFHGCVHNMLHEKNEDILKGLYKSASFIVQAIVFKQTGKYIKTQKELIQFALPEEKDIIDNFLHLKRDGTIDFYKMSEILFEWSKCKIENTSKKR